MPVSDWFKRHILPDFWNKPSDESRHNKRILVVDGEAHIRRLAEVNLRRQGYQVESADSGDDVLDALITESYDLVIVGSSLPDTSFAEMMSTLKADPDTEDIPLVCLLSGREEFNTYQLWRSGMDCFLTKPFNPMELIAFTRRVFKTMEEGADPVWRDHF